MYTTLNDYVVVYVRLLDCVPRAEKLLTRQCPSWLSIIRSETWTGRYIENISVIQGVSKWLLELIGVFKCPIIYIDLIRDHEF